MKTGLFLLFLFISHVPARGQSSTAFVVEPIGLKEGLPDADIHVLFRDRMGYLWLGTNEGLVRYDGDKFETISAAQQGRWLGRVNAIVEDATGHLWIGADDGLFWVENGTAHALPALQTERYVRMNALLLDKRQNLWCATGSGVYHLESTDLQTLTQNPAAPVQATPLPGFEQAEPIVSHRRVFALALDERQQLYIGGKYALYRYDPTQPTKPPERIWHSNGQRVDIEAIAIRNSHDLLFTAHELFCEIRLRDGHEERLFPKQEPADVCWHDGQFWHLAYGLYHQRPTDTRPTQALNLYGRTNGAFAKLLIDHEGIFWVATNEGLLKIRRSIFSPVPLPPTVGGGEIRGMGTYRGRLLAGAQHGRWFVREGDLLQKQGGDLTTIAGVSALHEDPRGTLWLGTTYQGLFAFDGQRTRRYTTADGLGDEAFYALFTDRRTRTTWAANDGGITQIRFDTVANTYRFRFYHHATNRYQYTVFLAGLVAPDGTLWLGSDYGLVSFRAGHFTNHRLTVGGAAVRTIRAIVADGRGRVWLATGGQGLLCGRFVGSTFRLIRHYTTRDGLPTNTLSDVLVDSRERVWTVDASTLTYLQLPENRVDTTAATIRVLNFRDGFFDESYQHPRLFEWSDTLWVGSSVGLTRLPLAPLDHPQPATPAYITSVRLRDVPGKPGASTLLNGAELAADQNALTVQFALLSLTNPAFNRYQFRLTGSGETWRTTTDQNRAVSYAGLRPGTYTFQWMGAGSNGVWSQPTSFTFTILPPFWQRGWFMGLTLLLLGTGTYAWVRWRERRLRAQQAEKARIGTLIAELETKAIRAQMNPHFIFNCLNSIQECILADDTDTAYRYLSKFARLLRMVLDESARTFHSIQQELDVLALYVELESLRFSEPIRYTVEAEPGVDLAYWQLPSLLLQPLVENAIWHGLIHRPTDRELSLTIRQASDETLSITLIDNGVGRVQAAQLAARHRLHTAKGLALVTDRLALLEPAGHGRGSFVVEDLVGPDGQPLGTLVSLHLPILTPLDVHT